MIARHRLDATLFILVCLALATLGASWILPPTLLGNAVLLGLAVLKGQRILLDYLGLRTALPIWRGLVGAWVLAVASFAWLASAAALLR
ncbi:MAG: hypothetical protein ABJA75_01525 [Bradyrhizobium sp.]